MLRRSGTKLLTASLNIESALPCASAIAQRGLSSAVLATPGGCDLELCSPWRQRNGTQSTAWVHTRGFSASGLAQQDHNEDELQGEGADALAGDELMGPDAISHAIGAAEAGALAESWDEAYFLNKGFQYLIQSFHAASGTPWWQSIALATLVCRVLTIPLVVKQMGNTANMSKAKPDLQQLADWFKAKQAEYQQEYMTRMAQLWQKHDCHPIKSVMPMLAQAPIFIGFFGALRSMAGAKVPSLMTGGPEVAWYTDLTIADPYYTLPILSSLVFLISIELNAADGMQDETTLKRMKNFMRLLAVAMVPLTGGMPMSVFCYWITSNIYSLMQGSALKLSPVRKFFGLPALKVTPIGSVASAASVASTASLQPVQTFSSRSKVVTAGLKASSKPATYTSPRKRPRASSP